MDASSAASRPRRTRRGARVLVRDADALLLVHDSDPGVPGSGWWVTPGGGIDDDEPSRAAAARELAEETGHRVDPAHLLGPVARRTVTHGYSDRILVQDEDFYLLVVDRRFAPVVDGWTETERQRMGEVRWVPRDELAGLDVWPSQAGRLAWDGDGDGGCVDLGEVEESTVPV